jgi:hypothetical protein
MPVGERGRLAAARGALEEAFLDQERLVDVLEGRRLLAHHHRQRAEPHRATLVLGDERFEQAAVHLVQAALVDLEEPERLARHRQGDAAVGLDERHVAHPAQQAVGDPRRAARPAGDLERRVVRDLDVQDPRRAPDDRRQVLAPVVVEAQGHAEARPERRGEQPRAGGGAHEREALEVELERTGAGPTVEQDVEREVLERRVEVLLDHRAQAVDLVHEQDAARPEIGEQPREVARHLDDRPRGLGHLDPQLVGDDRRERGLAEPGRAVEQDVVHGLAAALGGLEEDAELLAHRRLADELVERGRAEPGFLAQVLGERLGIRHARRLLVAHDLRRGLLPGLHPSPPWRAVTALLLRRASARRTISSSVWDSPPSATRRTASCACAAL